jgi:hypothetical protein
MHVLAHVCSAASRNQNHLLRTLFLPPTADAKRAKRAAKQAVSAAADKMDDDEGDFDFDAANAADGLVASEVGLRQGFCVGNGFEYKLRRVFRC